MKIQNADYYWLFWFGFINHGILRMGHIDYFVLFLFFCHFGAQQLLSSFTFIILKGQDIFQKFFYVPQKERKKKKNPQGWVNNDWFLYFWWNLFQWYIHFMFYISLLVQIFSYILSGSHLPDLCCWSASPLWRNPRLTFLYLIMQIKRNNIVCLFPSLQSHFFLFFTVISARLQRLCI